MVKYNNSERKRNNIVCNLLAQRDLEIEDLKHKYASITRIIEYGPCDQTDVHLVAKCMIFCKSEIERHVQEFEDFQSIE